MGPHDVVIFAKLLLSIYRKGFESLESIFFSDKDKDVYQPLADIFIEITARSKYRCMFSSRLWLSECAWFVVLRVALCRYISVAALWDSVTAGISMSVWMWSRNFSDGWYRTFIPAKTPAATGNSSLRMLCEMPSTDSAILYSQTQYYYKFYKFCFHSYVRIKHFNQSVFFAS